MLLSSFSQLLDSTVALSLERAFRFLVSKLLGECMVRPTGFLKIRRSRRGRRGEVLLPLPALSLSLSLSLMTIIC